MSAGEKMRKALTVWAAGRDNMQTKLDAWVNSVTGHGTDRDKTTYGYVLPSRLLADEELSSLYHGDDMAARMVDVVPQEMTREPFSIATGEPDVDTAINNKLGDIDTRGKMCEGIRWGRAFGGAGILIGCDDHRDADKPLKPERANDIDFLYTIDRRMLWPMEFYDEPGDPKLGQPKTYIVTTYGGRSMQNSIVHESRLILFRGASTGIREKQQLASWDLSVLQRAYDVLRSFNTGWKSVEHLLTDGNQAIFKMTGLSEMLGSSGGEALLRTRMQAMDLYRSVIRALVIDADGKESFERNAANFSNIPDTLDKFMLRLAAAVQIPVTILMGQSPAGMNATGESDFRWFYDRIRAEQNTVLGPKILRLVDIWLRTKAGQEMLKSKKLKSINVKFAPLWTETPLIQAQRELAVAQRDQIYVTIQAVNPDEVALHRFGSPEGFVNELRLSPEGVAAREASLEADLERLSSGGGAVDADGNPLAVAPDDPNADPMLAPTPEDTTSDLLKLTPSDLAAIVKVNEARASVKLPPLPGADGQMTLPQFKAKYATVIAAAANAEDGTTDDGSGNPHKSTIGVQPKKVEPPKFVMGGHPGAPGAPGAPPFGKPPAQLGPGPSPNPVPPALSKPKPGDEKLDATAIPYVVEEGAPGTTLKAHVFNTKSSAQTAARVLKMTKPSVKMLAADSPDRSPDAITASSIETNTTLAMAHQGAAAAYMSTGSKKKATDHVMRATAHSIAAVEAAAGTAYGGEWRFDQMKPFELHRSVDETGVSGTGHVADGVQFEDGKVALRWRTNTSSTTLFDNIEHMKKVHGHDGKTKVHFLPSPYRLGQSMAIPPTHAADTNPAGSGDLSPLPVATMNNDAMRFDDWNEEFHPRVPAGSPEGGQFGGGGGGGGTTLSREGGAQSGGGGGSPNVISARLASVKVNPERVLKDFPKDKLYSPPDPHPPNPARAQERQALARVMTLKEGGDAPKHDEAKENANAEKVLKEISPDHHTALRQYSNGYDYTMKQLEGGAKPEALATGIEKFWNGQLASKGIDVTKMNDGERSKTYQEHFKESSGAAHVATAQRSVDGIHDMFAKVVPTPGIAYRGMKNVSPAIVEKILNSKTMALDTMSSFSFDHSVAHDYATGAQASKAASDTGARSAVFGQDKVMPNGVAVVMHVTHKSGINMMGASDFKKEREVIMPKSAKFRITNVERGGYGPNNLTSGDPPHIIVHMEEI